MEMFAFIGDVLTFYPHSLARIAPRYSRASQERDNPRENARPNETTAPLRRHLRDSRRLLAQTQECASV